VPNPVFDRLPSIFVGTLGEPVNYTPLGGAPVTIQAIWTERSMDVVLGGDVATDAGRTTLSVRAEDVTPAEGDSATRVADSKVMTVSPPILPDGKGMIRCNLVEPV
jgi:hypothetical protein